jgi:hypothetical protein
MRRVQQQQGCHGQHTRALALDGATGDFTSDDHATVNFAANDSINFVHFFIP